MDSLVKLWCLPGAERRLLAEAWWGLLVVAIALRLLPFRPVAARAGRLRRRTGSAVSARRAAWLVAVAGRYQPRSVRCLERALVLQWALARRGRATVLRIGVRRDGGPLEAHAWIESGGRPIGSAGEIGAGYTPLVLAAQRGRS